MAAAEATPTILARAEQAHRARFARLVALILDTIFVGIIGSVATIFYGVTDVTGQTSNGTGFSTFSERTTLPWIATAAIWLGYYTICEAMFSATPGKAMNGLRVVSVDGRSLGIGSIILRNLLRLIDALPVAYLLGGAIVMLTPYSQRLGDFAGRTTVVHNRYVVEPRTARSSGRRAGPPLVGLVIVLSAFSVFYGYFGQPPHVIQTIYEEHQLFGPNLTGYSLGAPAWSWAHVRYPITAHEPGQTCSGYVELDWYGIAGWHQSGGVLDCLPS